jgi:UDPglucose 6-dehydrogenase
VPTLPHKLDDGRICVIGAGYVGLVTAAWLAETGRRVTVIEKDTDRLALLRRGIAPFHEPGLQELLDTVIREGKLVVSDDIATAAPDAGIVFVAVGTPPLPYGGADLSQVRQALDQLAKVVGQSHVVAIKSTVPPGTTESLLQAAKRDRFPAPIVVCPEFLREGSALEDCRRPARVCVGGSDSPARERVASLFDSLSCPVMRTDATSAEMIKYGSNAFLALKISFINEMAHLCELIGGDVDEVSEGLGSDPRIGSAFLHAGLGFGGSCFPKDVAALEETAGHHGHSFWLLKVATEINLQQRRRFVIKVQKALGSTLRGKRIAVLGLAFKPDTDDMRHAPSVDVIRQLTEAGALVTAYDPIAGPNASKVLPGIEIAPNAYACVKGAHAILIVTEWLEFSQLDWSRIGRVVRRKLVVDGRNLLDAGSLRDLGYTYVRIGSAPSNRKNNPA